MIQTVISGYFHAWLGARPDALLLVTLYRLALNIASTRLILLNGDQGVSAAGDVIEAHEHDAHQIVHALAGVMRVLADDGTWIVPPGGPYGCRRGLATRFAASAL